MAEAPVAATPQHEGVFALSTAVSKPRSRRGTSAGRRAKPARAVSEAWRAWNIERSGLVSELRCECGRPGCSDTVPGAAELYRGMPGRFVVVPAHFSNGVVVKAADQFFVVDPGRDGSRARNGLR